MNVLLFAQSIKRRINWSLHSTPLNLCDNTDMALWSLRSSSFDSEHSMRNANLFGYRLEIQNFLVLLKSFLVSGDMIEKF